MSKKIKIRIMLLIVFLVGLISGLSSSYAFDYIQDSLFKEVTYVDFELNLDKGDYRFVLDNTGYISKDYNRDSFSYFGTIAIHMDGYANVMYIFPFPYVYPSPSPSKVVPYESHAFNISERRYVSFKVNITANVTIFVCTEDRFHDFQLEVKNFLWERELESELDLLKYKRTLIDIIVSSIFVVIIVIKHLYFKRIKKRR